MRQATEGGMRHVSIGCCENEQFQLMPCLLSKHGSEFNSQISVQWTA